MLRRALSTVAAQTFADLEVIVADDGSAATSEPEYSAVVREFGSRVRFFKAREAGAPRSGPGAARNRAMERAQGGYLAFLDDDDQWIDAHHLAVAIEALEATTGDFFFANMQGVRNGSVIVDDYFPNSPELVSGRLVSEVNKVHHVSLAAFASVMRHHYVHPNMMVIRRELRERVGLFHEKIRFAEDVDWALRLGDAAAGILYRPACVAHIRLPEKDSSSLWEPEFNHLLDDATAAQHARASAKTKAIVRTACAKEAWAYRQLSNMLNKRAGASARSFARQAAVIYPTAGSLANWLKTEISTRG